MSNPVVARRRLCSSYSIVLERALPLEARSTRRRAFQSRQHPFDCAASRLRSGCALSSLLVLLLLAACFPPPYDERGHRCDATRACSGAYVCLDGRCAAPPVDAGVDDGCSSDAGDVIDGAELAVNGGFEVDDDGGFPALWRGGQGTLTSERGCVRRGARAARLTVLDAGSRPILRPLSEQVTGFDAGEVFCASAWLRAIPGSENAAIGLSLSFREKRGTSVTSTTDLTPLGAGPAYLRLTGRYTARGGPSDGGLAPDQLELSLTFTTPIPSPHGVLIDDVHLWRSRDAGCPWSG
ncbi:MAG: hypothetical protein IPJ65_02865 [Archangiaceae bacterium]|nr:hypothetical protein [Archangiaceae bacterium]